MKKILLGLNAVALPLATIATVVSCGDKPTTPKTDAVVTKSATLGDLRVAMLANTNLREDLSMLAEKNLNDLHAIKAVLKRSMDGYSKREGGVREFTFDTIINSMKSCEFVEEVEEKEKIKVLKMYFDKAKTEGKTLSVKGLTPSVKKDGTPEQLVNALKAKEKEFKSYLEKALIVGDKDENEGSMSEAILITTLNKENSFEKINDDYVKFTIKQTSDKNDFKHADVVITINKVSKITLNKLELQTKQVSSSLKLTIDKKLVDFNKETVKLTKAEITKIAKIKAILTGLKMNEFGKTYESIISQISKVEFTLNAESEDTGLLKLTFIAKDSITIENVKIKKPTAKASK